MTNIGFNKIYCFVDECGYINLLFIEEYNLANLFFDGINFHYNNSKKIKKFVLLNYIHNGQKLYIVKITQDFDITFIQLSNGDIFQIYSMFHDERQNQQISIFCKNSRKTTTPLGISTYEAAINRANKADEVEIILK